MTPERYRRLKTVFAAAAACPPRERGAYLASACHDDPELRREVEELLALDDSSVTLRGPLDAAGLLQAAGQQQPGPDAAPREIGGFRLLREIGRGGMGVVYEGLQEQPQRRVAVKLMRGAVGGARMKRRFRVEAEALGRLQHEGIARIFAAGAAPLSGDASGAEQPYLVMEYVAGDSLLDHVRRAGLARRARLALFAQICDAVQHAHQKGVIHRDLKPSNVIVDREGAPKVLDFGVARMIDDGDGRTAVTESGVLVGTLAYMSPEQISGAEGDLDTRSDIYSLGVLLYELLSGFLPHDVRGRTVAETVRLITLEPATPLSRRAPELRGDLETICMTALARDREQRYASAHALAADVRRFLGDEPIAARPASLVYQFRKFAARNRGLVITAGALVATLALAAGVSSWLALRAVRAEGAARAESVARAAAAADADQRRAEAELAAGRAAAVSGFLQDLLDSIDPSVAQGRDTAVLRELLDTAAGRIAREFADQPAIAAELHQTIGRAYFSIGELALAEHHLDHALALRGELEDVDSAAAVAAVRIDLADVWLEAGRAPAAEEGYRAALAELEAGGGQRPALRGVALTRLGIMARMRGDYDAGAGLLDTAAAALRGAVPEDDPRLTRLMEARGSLLLMTGEIEAAVAVFEAVVALEFGRFGADHPRTARIRLWLADALRQVSRFEEALPHAEFALERLRTTLGRQLLVADALDCLGGVRMGLGDYAGAEPLLAEGVELRRALLGDAPHIRMCLALRTHSALLKRMGRYAEAEPLMREAVAAARALGIGGAPEVASCLSDYAGILRQLGRHEQAEAHYLEALELTRAQEPRARLNEAAILHNLAQHSNQRGRFADALRYGEQALAIRRELLPPDSELTGRTLGGMASALGRLERYDEAIELAEQALDIDRRKLGAEHPQFATSLNNYAVILKSAGRYAEAEELYTQALDLTRAHFGEHSSKYAMTLYNIGSLRQSAGRPAEALAALEEALAIYLELYGADHATVSHCQSRIGAILLAKDQVDEAVPLLANATRVRQRVYGPTHRVTLTTHDRWADALEAAGDLTGAIAEHRALLEAMLEVYGPEAPQPALRRRALARLILAAGGDPAEARDLLRAALQPLEAEYGTGHEYSIDVLEQLAGLAEQRGDQPAAERWRSRLAAAGAGGVDVSP